MPLRFAFRLVKHGSLWTYRLLTVAMLVACLLFAAAVLLLRYWLLPHIDDYRGYIVGAVSRATKVRIEVGGLQGEWEGLRPQLILRDLKLLDNQGQVRLQLERVDSTLDLVPLFLGQVQFHSIHLQELAFEVRRDSGGRLLVAGIPIDQPGGGDTPLADWLLEQHRIELTDSKLTWVDETLGGIPLELDDVDLLIEQRFHRHRFGLRATPHVDVAAPLDLRGDLRGRSLSDLSGWWGQVYMGVSHANLAVLRQWIKLPAQTSQGSGSLRVWLTWENLHPRELTAEVALQDVSTRLADDLPELRLTSLRGLLGWRDASPRQEMWSRGLTFTTDDGTRLPPADISYVRTTRTKDHVVASDLRFDALELEAVVKVVDRLPVDPAVRARLAALSLRGRLYDFYIGWQDGFSLDGPYTARGSFRDLAFSPSGPLPGFSRLSGALQANQGGGTLSLLTSDTTLELPRVFTAPVLLDALEAQLSWTMHEGLPRIAIDRVSLSSPDFAGEISGRYDWVADGPGSIDLKGSFSRASGQQAWRYIPLVVAEPVRDWLKRSIVAAAGRDIRLTLRGDLHHFPWAHGEPGQFEVVAGLHEGVLAFAPRWPRLEEAHGQVAFRANRMEIRVDDARVYGIRLSGVSAVIPDLGVHKPTLELRGNADGSTTDFLSYLQNSPLRDRVGPFTGGMRAKGNGHLTLRIALPLDHVADVQLNGTYQFADNTLDPGEGWPVLEQFAGTFVFTQNDVNLRDGQARVAGAPARFTLSSAAAGSVRVQANGQVDADTLRRLIDRPSARRLSGATDWRLTGTVREHSSDLVLESNLVGLGSSLPAPFGKATQDRVPLRVEASMRGREPSVVTVALENVLAGTLLLERSNKARVARGEIVLGKGAVPVPPLQRDGVWISGEVDSLDVNQWQTLIDEESAGGGSGLALAGITLSAQAVRAFARDFSDVDLEAIHRQGLWTAEIDSERVSGELRWQPEGKGTLVGRFTRLQLPPATAALGPSARDVREGKGLPMVDITADDFRMGTRQFGRLALQAVPNGTDWRIERLDLVNPDGAINIAGSWQAWAVSPRTQVQLKVDVSNIGRFFTRLDLPKGVEGGKAKLEGPLSWAGPPYALDLPTLSGGLALSAANGRFVKVDPGIGKLLAVLSLQTLPKVATLDLRGIFSEGFAFDRISANVDIAHGVARTQGFEMDGPAAKVEMKGEVDLAAETQNLDVKIYPSMSESVALGTALVNPVVGLGALVVQKALRDPLGHMLALNYGVAGTWAQPTVTKRKREPVQSGPPGRK